MTNQGISNPWEELQNQPYRAPESTNAELLRLLERHHAAWVAEHRVGTVHYVGTELCEHTEAAIKHAKEKV